MVNGASRRIYSSRIILLLFSVVMGFFFPALRADIPTSERNALIAFYNATGGPNWNTKWGWLGASGTEHTWYGVTLNNERTHVIQLSLNYNNLTGSIPAVIGQLSALEKLHLTNNQLSGAIPFEISTCSQLVYLALNDNQLSGAIPDSIGNLPNLEELILSRNQLTGSIPTTIGNLSNLKKLEIYGNQVNHPRLKARA